MKKSLSIFLCMMLAMVFAFAPIMSTATAPTPPTDPAQSGSDQPNSKPPETKPQTKPQTKPSTKKTTAAPAKVGKLKVSSKRSTEGAGEGGKVTIVYTIENTGDVTAKSIKLKDSDIAGNKTIEEVDSLTPGNSKTINYEATMTKDGTSTPTVTCTMNGSSKTFTGEPVKISLTGNSSLLSATLTTNNTDLQPNTPTQFSVLLKNNDSKKITGISVNDHTGKSIKSDISLEANSTTTVDYSLSLNSDTNVYVNVKGKSSDGQDITAKSNELAMKMSGDTVAVADGLTITITADKTELEKKGEINLTLDVQNLMTRPYNNITITDKATGTTLQTIALLSGKDSKSYKSTVAIEKNTSFQYQAVATYEDGTAVTATSNSLEVKLTSGGLFSNMTLLVIIIVVIVLAIVAASVTLYILSKKEKEKNKSLGAAQSEKYKRSTPKKKASDSMPPPQKPISTFTISDEQPSSDTTPFDMPGGNAFDDYGNNNMPNIEEEPPFHIPENNSFNAPEIEEMNDTTSHAEFDSDNELDLPLSGASHEQAPPSQPSNPEPRKPMDYNDLDPD